MTPYHVPLELFWVAVKLLKTFGLIPGAAGAVWLRKLWQKRRQRKAMEGWPSTEVSTLGGRVQKQGWRNYLVTVTYSYFVGEYRSGTYLRHFRHEEQADEFVRQIKDKRLHVHYDAGNPDKSVLLDRDIELVALLVPQWR